MNSFLIPRGGGLLSSGSCRSQLRAVPGSLVSITWVLQGLGNSGARTGPGSLSRVLASCRVSVLVFECLMLVASAVTKQSQKQSQLQDSHCTRSVWTERLGEPECNGREGPGEKSLVLAPRRVAVSPLCIRYLC